jgi:serine phosphatase RsbU (regulator of sigma subunit)
MPGRKGAGIPISVKLILATSIVVAAAVGTSTWFAQTSINDVTEAQIGERKRESEHAIARSSELIVGNAATALAYPLPNNVEADIRLVIDAAIREDVASNEKRLRWMVARAQGGKSYGSAGTPSDAQLDALEKQLPPGDGVVRAQTGPSEWVYSAPVMVKTIKSGTVMIGVTTEALEQVTRTALAKAEEQAHDSRTRALLVSLVVLAIGVVLAALQGVQLAKPIRALTTQAERIGTGDLGFRVPEDRRDELGVLAHTFNLMADAITGLLHEQAQKASLEREMELARQVQQAMLPPTTLDQHGALKVVGYCMPASSCGGDWWTYRKLTNGRMLLVVGDATGHGIHSAMIAATARGAVEALSGIDERLLTPEQVLRAIDSAIRQVGDHNVIMTAFAAVFDSANGVLHYANAGQNFPYIIKLGQTRILEEASIIAASGNPLGDRQIAVEIRRGSLQLRPGDLFVCFTDGLVERTNPQGKLFGDRRLRSALTGKPLPDGPALLQLRDGLVAELEHYAENTLADDDITFVLCQYDPASVQGGKRESARRGAA